MKPLINIIKKFLHRKKPMLYVGADTIFKVRGDK